MPSVPLFTYEDAIDHVLDFLGANASGEARRSAKRAILAAYRDLVNAHKWVYLYQRGRLATVAPYSTGTIAYDHTGGANERQVTLASGTWPSWAAFGTLVIGTVSYEVVSRVSDSIITLSTNSNPGDDVAAGTSYTLYRDSYPLPIDCVAIDEIINVSNILCLSYQHPRTWINRQRIVQSPGTPAFYTVTGDPNYVGTLALRLSPPPDQAYSLDFLYCRRPRMLEVEAVSTGTVTVTNGAATVTGSGTAFTSALVGSVIRLSSDGTNLPTSKAGANPAAAERIVIAVASATLLTVDAVFSASLSAVKYLVSDAVDVEEGAMLTAFQRGCEYQAAITRNMKDKGEYLSLYRAELIRGMEADSRSFQPRAAGDAAWGPYRLRDYPAGADVS